MARSDGQAIRTGGGSVRKGPILKPITSTEIFAQKGDTALGLDIYVYHCADRAAAKAIEDEYERLSEAAYEKYGDYDKMTDEQKEEVRAANKKLAVEMGLKFHPEYDYEDGHSSVTKLDDIKSVLYPEHMFKIGYFRSSYNDGGVERVMHKVGLPGLYEIFEQERERYEFTPDWAAVRDRAKAAVAGYEKHLGSIVGDVIVDRFDFNPFIGNKELAGSEEEALRLVQAELERKAGESAITDHAYSNGKGTFFMAEPMEVIAVIPGTQKGFMGTLRGQPDALEPCMYIAYRKKTKEGEKDWYLQALEIVVESAEYVLSQSHPEYYYIHWSA